MVEKVASRKKLSLQNYKQLNGAVPPDRGFVKQLQKLCKTFQVVWDSGSHVWEIWDFPENLDPYYVMRVCTKDKTYRELGTDVLLQLQKNIFFHNNLTAEQICDYLDEMDRQVERKKAQDFRNHIRSIARDTFSYCAGILQVQVPRKFRIERMVTNG